MNYIIAGTIFLKYKLLETKCENYTIDRVSDHDTPDDAWVTYRNGVYNIVTKKYYSILNIKLLWFTPNSYFNFFKVKVENMFILLFL